MHIKKEKISLKFADKRNDLFEQYIEGYGRKSYKAFPSIYKYIYKAAKK